MDNKKALLLRELCVRLVTDPIHQRINNPKNKDHWCLKWDMKIIAHMSLIMLIHNHIKMDIECLDKRVIKSNIIQHK